MALSLTRPKPPVGDSPFLAREDGTVIWATAEQVAIINAGRDTKSNLLINALAGAAKTSTLEFLCKYLPIQPTLCVAFNKRIAEEMAKRLPGHVTCKTMNALGHHVWGTAIGRRLNFDAKKSYCILKALVDGSGEKDEAYKDFAETLRTVTWAKRAGY